jgi:26S proteasome regulatory subunit N7
MPLVLLLNTWTRKFTSGNFADQLRELARFIYLGRLNCRIDAVGGVIETIRPDTKNAQYHNTIKHGDLLLNRVQKLSRVIHL